jgi:hypothetical protein
VAAGRGEPDPDPVAYPCSDAYTRADAIADTDADAFADPGADARSRRHAEAVPAGLAQERVVLMLPSWSYRIESSCAVTGAYQHTEVVRSQSEMIEHCTAEWRKASVHVVHALPLSLPPRFYAVFAGGRCVSPLLNGLHKR